MNNQQKKPAVVIVCGPTGVGKTAAAIRLANTFGGEIVGADSMQIYQQMNIGTAKPTAEEQAAARHHMIDIVPPSAAFDAARYAEMARNIIVDLHRKGKLPIVAGGTGFYVKALTRGLFETLPEDKALRRRLREEAGQHGPGAMLERLRACDPESAQRLHPNDTYRILRALEVFMATGRPLSEHHRRHRFREQPFRTCTIGLTLAREVLYDRINRRVDRMLAEGLVDEVRQLLAAGHASSLKSMGAIGYRHMTDFIQGRLSLEEAVRTMKRDTRRYAKRQLAWFQAESDVHWRTPDQMEEMLTLVKNFLPEAP